MNSETKLTDKEKEAARLGFGIYIKITEALNEGLGPILEKAKNANTPEKDVALAYELLCKLQSVSDNLRRAGEDIANILEVALLRKTDIN